VRTEKAKVNGKVVTIYIPETPEDTALLQKQIEAGQVEDTGRGAPNKPGTQPRRPARRPKA
jgi:hypothetical protein